MFWSAEQFYDHIIKDLVQNREIQLNQQAIRCQVLAWLNKIWSCLIFIKLYYAGLVCSAYDNLIEFKISNKHYRPDVQILFKNSVCMWTSYIWLKIISMTVHSSKFHLSLKKSEKRCVHTKLQLSSLKNKKVGKKARNVHCTVCVCTVRTIFFTK